MLGEFESRWCLFVNDSCPWSVLDTHATLRRSRTRFDSWRGRYRFDVTNWPASVMDSTARFERAGRGSNPRRATDGTVRKRKSGQAQTLVPVGSNPTRATHNLRKRPLRSRQTMTNKTFAVRLADGREQAFDSAAAMVEWLERQQCPRRRATKWTCSKQTHGTLLGSDLTKNGAPLAHYANRHSGGA